jgi:hypothetical protein
VVADALVRSSPNAAGALSPAAAAGALLLVLALFFRAGALLGFSLALGGGTYIGAVVIAGHHVEVTAPLVAVGLLLCGELTAWSFDARVRIASEEQLVWRRGAAVGVLALLGLGAATLVVILSAVPSGHGLAWTIAGAVAAVAAVGTAVGLTRRPT